MSLVIDDSVTSAVNVSSAPESKNLASSLPPRPLVAGELPGAIPGFNAGVMIARLRVDTSLNDFELGVQTLVGDVERAEFQLTDADALRRLDRAHLWHPFSRIDAIEGVPA